MFVLLLLLFTLKRGHQKVDLGKLFKFHKREEGRVGRKVD